uniref:Uncharacterized protein n=1 Tax=Setaria italica TaxID=4555 RepID=K3Z1M7_SETIT
MCLVSHFPTTKRITSAIDFEQEPCRPVFYNSVINHPGIIIM